MLLWPLSGKIRWHFVQIDSFRGEQNRGCGRFSKWGIMNWKKNAQFVQIRKFPHFFRQKPLLF